MCKTLFSSFVVHPLRELTQRPAVQLPALDVLRTVAVIFVIAAHLGDAYARNGGLHNLFERLPIVRGGWMGVDLFFVLSGYLIGRQLWRELDDTNTINVRRFLLRRGLRIWPLYFFYFIFVVVVLGRGGFGTGKWWSDLLFITNYVNHGVVMGSWSLCTEEQFYIIAPLLLMLAGAVGFARSRCKVCLWLLLLLQPALRALTWWHLTGNLAAHDPQIFKNAVYSRFHLHSDGLIMGLLIAAYDAGGAFNARKAVVGSRWMLGGAIVACLVLQRIQREIFDFTGVTVVFGAALAYVLIQRHRPPSIVKARIFFLLSRLSYGMYLNHEYIHEYVAGAALRLLPGAHLFPAVHEAITLALLVTLSALLSVITFCLIESPFLRLRDRLLAAAPKAGRGRRALGDVTPSLGRPLAHSAAGIGSAA